MQTQYLIAANAFCASHNIDISFISLLQKNGLIEIITVEDNPFIEVNQLKELEKFIRFYYELDINLEGIETVNHLLNKINSLQLEIIMLKNKLRLFESEM
jgi:hypothetical protein